LTGSEATVAVYQRAGFGFAGPLGQRPAIVIVDFSNGFTDPESPVGSELADEVEAARRLIVAAREQHLPVLYTTIAYDPGDDERLAWLRKAPGLAILARGSHLVELDARLGRRDDEPIISKQGASAFFGTDLADRLHRLEVDTVIICGATTSGCVRATAVDAVQSNFAVVVVRDAVGDRAAEPHAANLFDIDAKYGEVIPLAAALDYVSRAGAAGGPDNV